jgi:hypothetical protein
VEFTWLELSAFLDFLLELDAVKQQEAEEERLRVYNLPLDLNSAQARQANCDFCPAEVDSH